MLDGNLPFKDSWIGSNSEKNDQAEQQIAEIVNRSFVFVPQTFTNNFLNNFFIFGSKTET